jgi:hypothetical protein
VERSAWHAVRGYDERNTARNHMEHEFITRLCRCAELGNLSGIGCPFFHQWHGRGGHHVRPHNKLLTAHELATLPAVVNGEGWGMRDWWEKQRAEQ